MTEIVLQVNQGSDDAIQAAQSTTNTPSLAGTSSRVNATGIGGVRFTNVAIPPGATIESAILELYSNSATIDRAEFDIYVQEADNPGTFQAVAGDLYTSSRERNTTPVGWSESDLNTGVNGFVDAPDISGLIQLLVDRAGWASGNAVVILIYGKTNADFRYVTYDGSDTQAPRLTIEYTAGAPASASGHAVSGGAAAGFGTGYGSASGAAVSGGSAAGVAEAVGTAMGAAVSGGIAEGIGEAFGSASGAAVSGGAAAGVAEAFGSASGHAVSGGSASGALEVFGEAMGAAVSGGSAAGFGTGYGSASGAAVSGGSAAGFGTGYGSASGAAVSGGSARWERQAARALAVLAAPGAIGPARLGPALGAYVE